MSDSKSTVVRGVPSKPGTVKPKSMAAWKPLSVRRKTPHTDATTSDASASNES